MMQCPLCNSGTTQVSVRADRGRLIVLDQCGKCGGIWCDKWELFPVDPDEAPRLDPLDKKRLQAPVALRKKILYCPRCRDRLAQFQEPHLPPDIQLQRCRRCDGIWLNKGQMSRYKRYQGRTKEKKPGPKRRVQKLAQAYDDPSSWVTVGTRGIFAYPRASAETDDWPSVTLGGAFKLILQALLRLVL